MATSDLYRISRRKHNGPWDSYGNKYTQSQASTLKAMLERKGWEVSVYRAA